MSKKLRCFSRRRAGSYFDVEITIIHTYWPDKRGRVTSSKGWPVKHGLVFLVPCKKWLVQSMLLCTRLHWTSHVLQDTRSTRPTGHPESSAISLIPIYSLRCHIKNVWGADLFLMDNTDPHTDWIICRCCVPWSWRGLWSCTSPSTP